MNIELQTCGFIMLLILLVMMLREKNLDISTHREFRATMIACIVCLAMDILSVIAIVFATSGDLSHIITLVICKAYLMLLCIVGYRGFMYSAAEFFAESTHKPLYNIYRVIFVICIVVIALLPLDYYCNGRVVYSYGPSAYATYASAFIFFASTIVMAMIGGERTSRRRKRVILLWQFVWIMAALVQLFRRDLLVVSFAAAVGMVLVYAELENPNEGIDRMTGQFNSAALHEYLTDLYHRDIGFSAMHISLDYGAGDLDLDLETQAIRHIAYFFDNDKDSFVFRDADRDFVVIYKSEEAMMLDYERASRDLKANVVMPINISYTLIPDSRILDNADEFMQFQHYNENNTTTSDCTIAGAEQAEEMRGYIRNMDKIRWALSNDSVEVFYQPIYEVKRGKFTTAEALVRIRDSEGDIVMPGAFIPVAEESGLIVSLGIEVFRQVCEFLATGEAQRLGIEFMDINLSMAQFNEQDPAAFVQRIMADYQIDPEWINLEITETADPTARQIILNNMQTLIKRGVRFSLDDFGTGRSNLDYFLQMPVSIIKFDRKFTHWYFEGEKSKDVMESIIGIMTRMDLPIVMEGIETKEELDTMISIGASYIQGFYFSKPLPREEFIDFMKANQ